MTRTILRHTESSGTDAGAAPVIGVFTRTLNTVVYDGIGVSLSGNECTLPAGLYQITGYAVANATPGHRAIIEEVNGAFAYPGSTGRADDLGIATIPTFNSKSDVTTPPFFCEGPTTIRLRQYFGGASNGSYDLGRAIGDGHPEIYAEVVIERLSC